MAPEREVQRRARTGDERKPRCQHCEIGSRVCQYDTTQESVGDTNGGFRFTSEHVWLDTPSEITFVHSVDISRDGDETRNSNDPSSPQVTISNSSTSPSMVIDDFAAYGVIADNSVGENTVLALTPGQSVDAIRYADQQSTPNSNIMDSLDPVQSLTRRRISGSTIYKPGPAEPLSDLLTARLLRHYMNNLACWLDVNDPLRQFETFVPYLALSCPILLYAILAFSACHLSRHDGTCDEHYAAHYHDLCVQGLIPALADPSTALDNVLPISTVVLRMYEMMSYETDYQRHLKGCSSLFTHNRENSGFRALKRTAFWTYFREEIMVALASRKPTTINPLGWKADIIWGGDFDYVKTEKMTMLTAEVVDYCFSREGQAGDADRWVELQDEVNRWKKTLPESFQPLYVIENSESFPEILYLGSWHIISMQFYHLVKVLLALHNPHHTGGIDFLHFARGVEAEIMRHTIQLCGMTKALGDKHPGALVNAIQPLVICGRNLRKTDEQAELVRMLRRIEQVTGLGTFQGIQSLQQAWSLHGDC